MGRMGHEGTEDRFSCSVCCGRSCLTGCDIRGVSAPEAQQPVLDYSWVATTPWAELAGHYDRHNAFIYKNYYERQQGYASGEIPVLLSNAYTSHPLAYYTLKREDVERAASGDETTTAANTAALHFKRGLTYYDLGDFDGAITEFSRAIQLDDRHARAYAFRALSYGYTGSTARAQSDLQRRNPSQGRPQTHRRSAPGAPAGEVEAVNRGNSSQRDRSRGGLRL